MNFLNKPARKRKRMSPSREPRHLHDDAHDEEGGADEATALISEATQKLSGIARRHNLEMLDYLLRMTHLEAEERLRLRSKKKLS
jgi:hypothetical protein